MMSAIFLLYFNLFIGILNLEFHMLILYQETLLTFLISSNNFPMEYNNVNDHSYLFCLPYLCLLFLLILLHWLPLPIQC